VVVSPDPVQESLKTWVSVRGRRLDVDQLGPVSREGVLVLQAGDGLIRSDPAVGLVIDAHEDVRLLQVGPVKGARGMGTAPSSNITGARRSRSMARRTALRSSASSCSVELTKTRSF